MWVRQGFKKRSYGIIAICAITLSFIFASISITYQNSVLENYLQNKKQEFWFIAEHIETAPLEKPPFEYAKFEDKNGTLTLKAFCGSFFEEFDPSSIDYSSDKIPRMAKQSRHYALFGPIKYRNTVYYFAEDITLFKQQIAQTIYFSVFGAVVLMLAAAAALKIGYSTLFKRIDRLSEQLAAKLREAQKGEQVNAGLLAEYKAAVDASNIVSKTDVRGIITYVNDAFCEVSGYSKKELLGKPQSIVRHPNMPKAVFKEMWETILNKKVWKGIIENRRKDGSSYFVNATIVPILGLDGEIIEFLGIRHDITEFINNKQKMFTNSLTGLPNRYKLSADLAGVNEGNLAVVNIDSFKVVNDFYGNETGDFILKELAIRLSKIFTQKGFFVYKLSSDEYAIFCDRCEANFESEVSFGINRACSDGIKIGDVEVVISVSVGISGGKDKLLEKASMALEFAKKNKKQLAVYNESMLISKNYEKNLTIGKTIRDAIDNDYFIPYFQPIVNAATGEIEKYETLARIVKPGGEVLTPYSFLDVAKATRLYPHITRAIVMKAFETFMDRSEMFSINLSVEDMLDIETREFIFNKLADNKIAKRVIFEILESEGIENYEEISVFLEEAKKRGVAIAIDDFGTGYSNFEHLSKLNVDIIKIDGSLIKNINNDENAQIITETMVGFAKRLGMKSVAEFVHSKEVYDKIREIGVDYAQGYYLGQPAPM